MFDKVHYFYFKKSCCELQHRSFLVLQTDSLPDIENILRISLECKALLNALHIDSSPRQTQRDSEDASGEVGMLSNKAYKTS